MRVAVVGLGAVGGAALRFLAQQGHEAVGYEQFIRGHTRGSSHGESRIYRLTYADPHYTRLMRDAFPLWQARNSSCPAGCCGSATPTTPN